MKQHNNNRANRLTSDRWRCNCEHYNRKSSGCNAGHRYCNPHKCLKYKEKYPKGN